MKLSVIIPVYNEAKTIKQAVSRLMKQKQVSEVIIVNDGSTDHSKKIITQLANKKIKVTHHHQNLGKGAAIHTALKKVSGDHILIQDADLEYDPKDITTLIAPIIEKKAKVVYGSRFKGSRTSMFFWHYVANNFLNLLVNILFDTTLSDMETCYKLIPTNMMKSLHLTANDFGFEPEVTCQILKTGEHIFEVPISYTGRTYEEGKKLNWKDGFKALAIIIKERLTK